VVTSHGRFAWYELLTTDVATAKVFYSKVMGWGMQDMPVPGSSYTLLAAENFLIGGLMELPEDAIRMGARPSWLGYVGVDDVDVAADRITRLGGALYVPPTDLPNVSRFSIFVDPQAARLALLKWLRPGQQQPADPGILGCVGWHELLAADWEQALAFYGEVFGWKKANADIGEMGTYQLFSAGGQTIGGMLTKPEEMPIPLWLYYFNVDDVDAAGQRVKDAGGRVVDGPTEVSGGSWIVQCADPQGAIFALEGTRSRKPPGYFERKPRDPSDKPTGRWSW
jgi:predicted enzyme related to lactoylglutathione lyase